MCRLKTLCAPQQSAPSLAKRASPPTFPFLPFPPFPPLPTGELTAENNTYIRVYDQKAISRLTIRRIQRQYIERMAFDFYDRNSISHTKKHRQYSRSTISINNIPLVPVSLKKQSTISYISVLFLKYYFLYSVLH